MTQKQTFDVSGMTCAACSARVEKTTSGVAGVEHAVVNLLKNSMEVEYDGNPATLAAISAAVEKTGYGAAPRVEATAAAGVPSGPATASAARENAAAKEAAHVRMRLIVSFVFTIPLFYLSMGHMFGWPLPAFFLGHENMLAFAFTQFLLLLPVVFVNFKFFRVGFKTLFHGSPNMDSLIALGSTASTVYGIVAIYRIGWGMGHGDIDFAHMAAMDLYFESAAMIAHADHAGQVLRGAREGEDHRRNCASLWTSLRKRRFAATSTVPRKMSLSSRCDRGISSSFALVRACLSTEWWSKARARSTSPSSRAKAYRWKRAWGLRLRVRR